MISSLIRSTYARVQAARFSLSGPERFYNPISAALLSDIHHDQRVQENIRDVRIISRKDGLTIWQTRLGELATMESECKEHVAFLVTEFQPNQYFSDKVTVGPGATVLDVGANVGLFTRAALIAGAQRVVCMEPTPNTLRALRRNVEKPGYAAKVSIVPKGAWDVPTTLKFTVDPVRPGRSSCVTVTPEKTAYEISIEVDRIDNIVRELALDRLDFIKMDIEGAEMNALKGAANTLRRFKPNLAIAVEHTEDRLKNAAAVRDLVTGINPAYRCEPGTYSVTERCQLAPEILYFW
jgi:FkbM family methyltransferase